MANLRLDQDYGRGEPGKDIEIETAIDPAQSHKIELDNGGVIIEIGPPAPAEPLDESWDANLALELPDAVLSRVGDDLLRAIEEDDQSRREWLENRAKGIELLGLKIEAMRASGGATGSAPLEGMSQFRDTLLLESVIRWAANAFAEMCPTDGPAKVGEETFGATPDIDNLADCLEKDLNKYLTVVDKPWVPDTDAMIVRIAVDGCQFKKVYHDPILRRPVSRAINAEDLIVNNAATSLFDAGRITHRSRMRPSMLKRMQILKVYRNVPLLEPGWTDKNAVDQATEEISGIRKNDSSEPKERDFEIFECYCEYDIPGLEHKTDGEADGLAVPYKVTIDKESRQVLEIRRNWDEEDELCLPKTYFVQFPFIRGFGFYGIGLSHMLGNMTSALTAISREFIDNGMFANFPGGVIRKGAGGSRQNSSVNAVPPGGMIELETDGLPIQQVFMALPYKDLGPVFAQFVAAMQQNGQRLGGTADVQVGEGGQDAPVGTVLAMIEQAIKPMLATHKRLCQAESDELQLLVERFREDPESFWRGNKQPTLQWDKDRFFQAINNNDIAARADPNTASHMQRMMRNAALYQMAKDDPTAFNLKQIRQMCIRGIGFANPDQFLVMQQPATPPDPKAIAAQTSAQADLIDAQARQQKVQFDAQSNAERMKNDAADRQSKEKIAQDQLDRTQIIEAAKMRAQHAGNVVNMASDQVMQARDQAHEANMAHLNAALEPPSPPPGAQGSAGT